MAQTGWIRERLGTAGQISNTTAVSFNLRYPGQQFDSETGLFYNHHRTYDPYLTIGYTEADPLGLAAGWNRFNYVVGNALGDIDPEGLWFAPGPGYRSPCATAECAAGVLPTKPDNRSICQIDEDLWAVSTLKCNTAD